MTTLFETHLGTGPAATITDLIPDLDYYNGRGAKQIIPLWRDSTCTKPNVAPGVLAILEEVYEVELSPQELFEYCYAIMGCPAYVDKFYFELEDPGPRLPITKSLTLFRRVVAEGRRLINLHTYSISVPGKCRQIEPVAMETAGYPEKYEWIAEGSEFVLSLGGGRFGPISEEVKSFQVSGMYVVDRWLGYRLKVPKGKSSSELDQVGPITWNQTLNDELLDLIHLIEESIAMYPLLASLLEEVTGGPCVLYSEFPPVPEHLRTAPEEEISGGLFLEDD